MPFFVYFFEVFTFVGSKYLQSPLRHALGVDGVVLLSTIALGVSEIHTLCIRLLRWDGRGQAQRQQLSEFWTLDPNCQPPAFGRVFSPLLPVQKCEILDRYTRPLESSTTPQ
jgi:hypothetical protein